ncbi:MAG: MFS transporter [Thermoplasmatota archaeon]
MSGPPRAARTLSIVMLVLFARVLGLSLVLSVFAPYGARLTPSLALVGIALGAYGLAMAVFQIPFGLLSDRIGRKPAMLVGLALSAAGAFASAFAPSIGVLIAARFAAGTGAVNGIALALVADAVPSDRRTMAYGLVGAGIGLSFMLGLVAGPLLAPSVGVPGLFALSGFLALAALLATFVGLEARPPASVETSATWAGLWRGLKTADAMRLHAAAFVNNFALSGVTFALPLLALAWLPERDAWQILAPAILIGGLGMAATSRAADRGHARFILVGALALLAIAPLLVFANLSPLALAAAGALFFFAQATLAATLPSAASRFAAEHDRGAVLSAFSVAQYLGSFAGAALAGTLYGSRWGLALLVAALAVASALYLRGLHMSWARPAVDSPEQTE